MKTTIGKSCLQAGLDPKNGYYKPLIWLCLTTYTGCGKTLEASNTGPSTQTRFMVGPSSVCISIAQPAHPPTAQAMYSSMDIWQGSENSCASLLTALSMGVGPQEKISILFLCSGATLFNQHLASSVT